MALASRNIPITRQMVYEWLMEFEGQRRPTKKLRDFLEAKIDGIGLRDLMVRTENHDDLDAETSVVDMILKDLHSYGS